MNSTFVLGPPAVRSGRLARLARATLIACGLLAFVSAPAAAQFDLFSWTPSLPLDSTGFVTTDTLQIVGPDNPMCTGGQTAKFTTTAPFAGTVLVHLTFLDLDKASGFGFDYPVLIVDGVETQLGTNSIYDGKYALAVPAGSSFGFGVHSLDCYLGPGVATFTQFQFVPSPLTLDVEGGATAEEFGAAVASLSDLDGDSVDEVLAGAPGASIAGADSGRVVVLSGASGALLRQWLGAAAGDRFGTAVAGLPDMNADGAPDVFVGAPGADAAGLDAGLAQVLSSANGAVLLSFSGNAAGDLFGTSVAGVGDISGDGVSELLVGAPRHDTPGKQDSGLARLFSGQSGATLRNFLGGAANALFGTSVAGAGDVNADGAPDLIVGAPGLFPAPGSAQVFSGFTGATLYTFNGTGGGAVKQLGQSVAAAGDVNGDGHGDVVLGAPGTGTGEGRIALYSGIDGALLLAIEGTDGNEKLGTTVAGVGDVDGDGVPDIAGGASETFAVPFGAGEVQILSGRTGQLLQQFAGLATDDEFGAGIAGLGDIDGDGFGDLVAGAPGTDVGGPDAGRITIIRPRFVISSAGNALEGSRGEPVLAGKGLLVPGTTLELKLSNALENSSSTLILGLSALYAPFKGGVLVPTPNILLTGLPTGPSGTLTLGGPWPAGIPSGVALYAQHWIIDAAAVQGFSASNALHLLTP